MLKLGKKLLAFVCAAIGVLIGHSLFEGSVAAYVAVLISYHLYFFFLLATTPQEETRYLSVPRALFYHLIFVIGLVGITYGRRNIPGFVIIRWFLPSVSLLEVRWMLKGQLHQTVPLKKVEEAPPPPQMVDASIDDHEAFREHMMQPHRPFRKPGISIAEEFNLWHADRQQKKAQLEALRAAAAQQSAEAASSTAPTE